MKLIGEHISVSGCAARSAVHWCAGAHKNETLAKKLQRGQGN